ncbi:uncharacterized protein LOC130628868 [Hydractinia symbiolongicarpus]|uniref:uncharacterized protein LOC130628868 n=1 Tax=Hydractinia symbiolongicarpus TaxID=13093 RepID=UPI00254BDB2B|nr:uncharacterized protein LOC130628868 [Hydractinia symbiolongicarpus]
MGCAQSNNNDVRRESLYERRNTLVVKPHVNVKVGGGIRFEDINGTKIIFIFGGPGSGKGTIVNNLVDMYNFHFVCGEDLILEKLIEKLLPDCEEAGTGTTKLLSKKMEEDPSQLTLHWVLELIEEEIEKHKGDTILVDIVPNLKFLLKVPTFVKNCEEEMEQFENKHPVAFAINLLLDQDHLISNINQTHACTKAPSSGQTENKGSSDEMDTSRTQRRYNMYNNSVKEFLSYFENDDRLLTVDTSCGKIDVVWDSVRDYVVDSDIAVPVMGLDQVVLFKTSESDFSDVDRERYPMLDVNIKTLVSDSATATPEALLHKLVAHLRVNAIESKTFVVDITGTSLCLVDKFRETKQPRLMFLELEMGQLDFFIHGLRRRTERKKSLFRKQAQYFRSITTSENDALIFPQHTDVELCHRIGEEFIIAKSVA